MKSGLVRWLSAILTIAALALAPAAMPACSHSHPAGGNGPDASDDGDGGNGDGDANASDAADNDGNGGNDAAAIDARVIDASPDAAIDAPTDAPIDGNGCPTQPCAYNPQCGCAAPLVCDIDFTDLIGTSCRAVNAPGNAQSTCGSFSECAGDFTCVMAGGGMRCEQFCSSDMQCAQPRGKCIIQIQNQQGMDIDGAVTCSSNCNPLSTTTGGACPANWKCGFFTIGQTDIVDCELPGAGQQGTTCNTDADCSAGTMCSTVTVGGVPLKRCRRVCNKTAGGQECAAVAGTSCLGFVDPLTIAGTEYGICAP
ncbi:MAG TPA: hypothetical protein VHE35_35790 [Kofleriaceae bacterium]|nr:hypothetical protein [Kofleriaceae bacterium]